MTITIHAHGAERKRLVQTISDWLGVPAKYCGAPTFNYEVDYFTIDRNGSLSFDDRADSEVIERLLQHIYDEGFDIDQSHTDDEDEPCAVCISMPKSLFTDSNLENLKALIAAKGSLIKKALGVADLPLEITGTKVSFHWFPATPTPAELKAYDTFICKLCEMARNQKRINATEKPTDNEKYAFRCFLLRLGFIGSEYKGERKILLKNLIGREYTLLWAKDGVEAIEMYKQYQPDLILMDIKMPRMDGLEATHIIRSYSKDIPIIALTAYAFETDKELALEMGCNDFVTKPVSERTLRKALDKYSTIV